MKRKIITVLILLALSVPSYAQFWKNFGNALKEVAVGFLFGAVDNMVQNSNDQQTIANWDNIKSQYEGEIGDSYNTTAGYQIGEGDVKGAGISVISSVAIAAGVRSDVVALGNSGLNNFVNGDKTAAIIDITQMATHATGNDRLDVLFDFHRDFNQINRQYRENIHNGMSAKDAQQVKNDQLADAVVNVWDYMEYKAEEKEMIKARKKEVKMALISRGYSDMEAEYLSTCLSIEDIENEDVPWSSTEEMLDYHDIDYREPFDGNVFFDDPNSVYQEPNQEEVEPVAIPEPTPIQPVDPSAEAKSKIKEIAPDRYLLNHVGLNKTQKEALDEVASLMNQYPNIRICLNGNTCDLGTDQINNMIATKRAEHAKEYLVKKGIDASRINVESKASSEPVVNGQTGEARLQNRRISITILED